MDGRRWSLGRMRFSREARELRQVEVGIRSPNPLFWPTDLCCAVFRLPLELFLEILSYFSDHRRFIRENFYGRELFVYMERKHAERSIVIRRLTMTCWPLRNLFLPLLWVDAEGCISHTPYHYKTKSGGVGSSLYAQCVYLFMNPAIAAFVQSVQSSSRILR